MARTLSNVPVHSGSKFTWSGKTGSAELSDFNPATLAGRLYGDACDVGFYVQSHKSGEKVLFSEERIDRDAEGEILRWHYTASNGCSIVVFND